MKVYTISGLGADERVFSQLKLNYEVVHIKWVKPIDNEPIADYARRLSKKINENEDFALIGVSFGGLIAVELSKILSPKITILISSASTKYELRPIYHLIGRCSFLKRFPTSIFNLPTSLAFYLFGAKNKSLLQKILNDSDSYFTKWAILQLLNWQQTERIENIYQIHGTNDKLIPSRGNSHIHYIHLGEHFMIVDKAQEISLLINIKLKEYVTSTS